ncbi:MAG: hypothetical protein COV76_03365 [Candidatus Omnitrophica bacterium CG11_big_fil_rev_8_21_14_0_20_64_10]|nr:MAG: hypothetical protein COV76_03365 [Candidatus Omnitrophica bacterium CG11_big_fil_rev_8_21_14_0_20_64_10]
MDREGIPAAAARAARWIARLAGGKIVSPLLDVGLPADPPVRITLRLDRAQRALGIPLRASKSRRILERIGCRVRPSGRTLHVEVPSFRPDLRIPEDLHEELARLIGYDRFPLSLPPVARRPIPEGPADPRQRREQLRCGWATAGFQEVRTLSLLGEAVLARCGWETDRAVALENPLNVDQGFLRPSFLPGILETVSLNLRRGRASAFRLFEMGRLYRPDQPISSGHPRDPILKTFPPEREGIGFLAGGSPEPGWGRSNRPDDLPFIKGVVADLLSRGGWGVVREQPDPKGLDGLEGPAVLFQIGERSIGWAGRLSRKILDAFEIPVGEWIFGAMDLETLLSLPQTAVPIEPPAKVPPIVRDLAVVVPEKTPYAEIEQAIHRAAGPLLRRLELFDLYRGKPVPAGSKSLALRLTFFDPERTLTDAEAAAAHQKIVEALQGAGAALR